MIKQIEIDSKPILEGQLQTPNQRRREFMNMSAALDYCSLIQPISLSINYEVGYSGKVILDYIGRNE